MYMYNVALMYNVHVKALIRTRHKNRPTSVGTHTTQGAQMAILTFNETELQPQFDSFQRVALRRLAQSVLDNIIADHLVQNLEDLLDVDAVSPDDGDSLTYNTGTNKWEAGPAATGTFTVVDNASFGTTTAALNWVDTLQNFTVDANTVITIPAQATVAWPDDSIFQVVKSDGSGTALVIEGAVGVTIIWAGDQAALTADGVASVINLKRIGTNSWLAYGDQRLDLDELNDLSDVVITTPVSGQGLSYNGSSWVNRALSPVITTASTALTLTSTHQNSYLLTTSGSPVTLTVDPQSTGSWADNAFIEIEQGGAGAITIAAGSGVTINRNAAFTAVSNGQYAVVGLKRISSNTWTLFGNLVP